SNISDYKIARHPDGRVAIVWTEPEQFSSDLFAVFYDPVAKLCGKPQRLTDDSETEHSPVVAFYDHDTLISIYDRVYLDVFEEKMCLSSGKNVRLPIVKSISTDLAFFIHTITEDVSFETGSFVITPRNPQIGSTAEIYITIENTGNTVLSNIPVYFYADDPDNGGTLIGNTIITSNLVPGETTIVSVEWEVPAVSKPVTIYAVIDPEDTLSGEISSNNTTSIDCIFPDIGSANLTGCFITEDLLFVTGTLQNIGSLPSGQFVVEVHRDSPDGELIYQDNINQLLPNEIRQINFLFNVTDPKNLYLYLIADPQNAVREYDETNNMYVYKLNPSLLMGDINDDGEVDISDVILCLRMAIGLPVVINSQ
ncbi:MAG TPA: CARDB domain-containing protein, partial [bacterium]|nr:CARDB domain-containing protein [bacterium]